MKLEISLFKFDHKSDYLPYYKKFFITVKHELTLLDILNTINEEDTLSYENTKDFGVCLNGLYTTVDVSIENIKNDFGKELVIEPLSIRRAHSDLLINEEDFNEKFSILSEFTGMEMLSSFVDKEDKKAYDSYKLYFYASNTMNVQHQYIGDAILLLASDLIAKNPLNKHNILSAISNCDYGIDFHTSLENRVYNIESTIEEKINQLKKDLDIPKEIKEQNFRVNATKKLDFGNFKGTTSITHDFNDFNIAYYHGEKALEKTTELLNALKAKKVNLDSKYDDLALDTFHINPDFTYKLASTVMLEAFDKSADLLVVDSAELFYLMDYNRKELSRVSGRDIEIPVIHRNELEKLALGSHITVKESLDHHIIDPELI